MLDSRHTLPDGAQLELLELTRSMVGHCSRCIGGSVRLGVLLQPESRAERFHQSPATVLGPAFLTSGIYLVTGFGPGAPTCFFAFHPIYPLQAMKCLEGPEQGQVAS